MAGVTAGQWLMAASTAVSAASSYSQGKAREAAAEREAQRIEENARRREEQGELEAAERRRQKRIALSDARAAQAASGGTTTSGMALTQQGKLAREYEYNALASIYDARVDAQGLRGQASGRRTEGRLARRASTGKSLSTALRGGSDLYQSYQTEQENS